MNAGFRERAAMPTTYNFHDLFTVRVAHPGLDALMQRELEVFLDEVDTVDLTVEVGSVATLDQMLSVDFSFDDRAFVVETRFGRIQLAKGSLRAESVDPSEMLRWVKYVMRQGVVKRDASFLHAAAVSRDGVGCLFPAWGHAGKTNVILNFLLNDYDYMSDDWCFLTGQGELLAYPRHLELFQYNFECYPDLVGALEGRRARRRLRRQLAATRAARSLSGSHWLARGLGRWLSDRYFVSVKLPVSQVVPGCRTVLRAPLARVCLLTTARSGVGTVADVPPEHLARKVALFGHYERSRYYKSQVAMAYAGRQELEEDVLPAEADLLSRAFAKATCMEVTIPPTLQSRDVDRVRELVEAV